MKRFGWLTLATSFTLAVVGRETRACGATPPAYWTLTGASPAEGQRMPADGAILLTARPWTEVYPDRDSGELASVTQIEVFDSTGAPVEGVTEPWYAGATPTVAWRPQSALPASTTYRVEAIAVNNDSLRPGTVTGEATLRTTFVTEGERAPPLRLQGELTVALETYDQPTFAECVPCGGSCPPSGSVRALRARVTIPAIDGGFTPDDRYGVWLRLHDGPGGLVNLDGLEPVPRGRTSQALRAIPEEAHPYAPCFDVRVTDPAGHSLAPPPLCLPVTDVKQTIRTLDGTTGGCALVGAGRAGGWWLTVLALVGLLRRFIGLRPRTRVRLSVEDGNGGRAPRRPPRHESGRCARPVPDTSPC